MLLALFLLLYQRLALLTRRKGHFVSHFNLSFPSGLLKGLGHRDKSLRRQVTGSDEMVHHGGGGVWEELNLSRQRSEVTHERASQSSADTFIYLARETFTEPCYVTLGLESELSLLALCQPHSVGETSTT